MTHSRWLVLLFALAVPAAAQAGPIRVDINPDNGRRDMQTPGWHNWAIKDSPSVSTTVDGVKVTIRKAGGAGTGLAVGWWKGGLDYGVTMANDGVSVKDGDQGGQFELVLSGLAPGRHLVVTYHNSLWDVPLSRCDILVNGTVMLRGVRQGPKCTDPYDAVSAAFEVEAAAGKDVVTVSGPTAPVRRTTSSSTASRSTRSTRRGARSSRSRPTPTSTHPRIPC
jgi:hypothetical protein